MSSCEETECFTAHWNIVNFSLLSSAGTEPARSPIFKTETIHGISTWWRMLVYYSESNVRFKLLVYNGGSEINRCEMSLSTTSHEVLLPLTSYSSKSKTFEYSIKRNEIFRSNRHLFLLQDTLTICCRIWQNFIKPEKCRYLTVLHKVNLLWEIKEFRFSDDTNRSLHQQGPLQLITIIYTNTEKGTHSVRVETCPNVEGFTSFVNCKLSVKDGYGRCISSDFIHPTTGWLWHIIIYDHDSGAYNLRLQLQSLIAVEMKYQRPPSSLPAPNSNMISTGASEVTARSPSSQKEDFLLLYEEGLYSDATLTTEDKSFPVHKAILSARSEVFRAMFETNNTSEGISGNVNIEDINSKTLERMLVFLYGDTFEDMQWEDALALYYAADKYAIHSLKLRCADILKAGVAVSNVCRLLVLADNHSDEQLIRVAVEFIHDHDEVISTAGWVELEDSNSKLTTKIMRELYLMQRGAIPIINIA